MFLLFSNLCDLLRYCHDYFSHCSWSFCSPFLNTYVWKQFTVNEDDKSGAHYVKFKRDVNIGLNG